MKSGRLIIVTGVGFRPKGKVTERNIFSSKNIKPNIGAWVSKELVSDGYDVLMISKSENKLKLIKTAIQNELNRNNIEYLALNILLKNELKKILKMIISYDEIGLVHCVGMSAGSYQVPNDNPYLEVSKTPLDLPILEFEIVVKTLLNLVQILLPIFKRQKETRIVVVSSMSGIRAFPFGYSHSSAKAGLHHAVRSLCLELNKKRIFISEVLPGIVNTGLYDNKHVEDTVIRIGKSFGYYYRKGKLPQMPPREVARAVKLCLSSEAHILSINMVAKGQWPNLGA